ncbi:2-hydroxychromene-2-carboxylate isomerase [Sneathiella marina]|uniref:2-hydroxychromene-2-carboxylate isomerase n=1 Tax=Sneathiella marina TaxID=2950108 RepID=A0ABY4W1N5_9PROT|nr:2-hydroxychromene-2-carboxylate isomerase [Sneathiella marina]USG60766.1 2-hydroxychromene-2-carboxylate isomerase [Sneathiella marina]
MTKTIDYYVTLVSPWTFMGHDRLVKLAEENEAVINILPVNFGRVFSETGGLPLAKRSQQRQDYRLQELARWKIELDLPIQIHPKFFPASDQIAALMVMAAKQQGLDAVSLGGNFLRAVWVEEKNIADEVTAIEIANSLGMNGQALFEDSQAPEFLVEYNANTEIAINRGAFGAPSYIVDDEVFWGQDRLHFVEKKLK